MLSCIFLPKNELNKKTRLKPKIQLHFSVSSASSSRSMDSIEFNESSFVIVPFTLSTLVEASDLH